MSSDKYDLFSPRFKADPFPTYAAMREQDPVYPHAAPDGRTIWYVSRYDDVAAVLRDDRHFCKDPRNAAQQNLTSLPRPIRSGMTVNHNMLFSDPPDHTRLRALVSQAFTPRRVAGMSERIRATADTLLDRIVAEGATDLIHAFALPLPVVVISDMLGIPTTDRDDVADWSRAIISPGSRGLNYSARKRKMRAFVEYLRRLFARRRADPQDDLISALVTAGESAPEPGDGRLSEAELFSMVALLLVTGHETTVNLIGNGVLALLRRPDQLERLRVDEELWPAAVEELLRFDGPVETSTSRWVREDVNFGGHAMRRGDLMRAVITSANRDPAQFTRPDELDVSRVDHHHLAFGLGAHYCLGAPLARLEGSIALEALFRRLPDAHLGLPPEALAWRSGVLFRGLKELPIAWRG